MKTVFNKAVLLRAVFLLGAVATPAAAQTPVTVPPATAPMPVVTSPAMDTAPTVMPAAAAAPTVAPANALAEMPMPAAAPATAATAAVVTTPVIQPAMPSAPVAAVTAPPASVTANLPTGTPTVVKQVMGNLQDAQSNVSVEDLSKAQDALTRLDLLLQIEKKIGEIKKTQDDRESNGAAPGSMVGQIPASALVLPGQSNGMNGMGSPMGPMGAPGMPQGMPGQMGGMGSPVMNSKPVSSGKFEVQQISGMNGSYNAILKDESGDIKTVRVGDKLDGRTVQSIGLDGVHLDAAKGSKKGGKTLAIHNDGVLLTPMAR